jgi:predicted PurR-regulated permease PerM
VPIVAALAVVAIILYEVRYALLPFVFAAAIGFVADPLIVTLQRRRRGAGPADRAGGALRMMGMEVLTACGGGATRH